MSTKSIKPKIAFFDFACCEGCQLTVADALQTHLELLGAVEIVNFREVMSEKSDDYFIAFVEGSCTRTSDEARLKVIRENAQILVALGACAHIGGVNAIRTGLDIAGVRRYVYGEKAMLFETNSAKPIDAVVPVDASIPGCPIDREEFVRTVKALLLGRIPVLHDYPVCVECKMKENVCLYTIDKTCLGPITRAGCGAICPTFGVGCEGCRGLISNPNIPALKEVFSENGFDEKTLMEKMRIFLSYQTMESES
jgi:coenzyme F420-reducing hydrogenase gamma subunit